MIVSFLLINFANLIVKRNFGLHLLEDNWLVVIVAMISFSLMIVFSAMILAFRRGILNFRSSQQNILLFREGE